MAAAGLKCLYSARKKARPVCRPSGPLPDLGPVEDSIPFCIQTSRPRMTDTTDTTHGLYVFYARRTAYSWSHIGHGDGQKQVLRREDGATRRAVASVLSVPAHQEPKPA